MARYQPRDADFVLAGDDTLDEELARPSDLDPPWVRRGGRPAAYLLAASVVAGCLLRISGTDTAPTAATPPRTPVVDAPANDLAAQGFIVSRAPAPRTGNDLISDDLSDACPSGRSCLTSAASPPPVLAALRAAFPGVTDVSVRTVSLPLESGALRMLGRIVHATAGYTSVTVQVLSEVLPRTAGLTGSGNGAIATVQRPVGDVTVRTTVAGIGVSAGPDAPSSRLAADPRVLVVR